MLSQIMYISITIGIVARACYLHNGDLYCIIPIQDSDVCCFDGFFNYDESGVKSESEKGEVNSRLIKINPGQTSRSGEHN